MTDFQIVMDKEGWTIILGTAALLAVHTLGVLAACALGHPWPAYVAMAVTLAALLIGRIVLVLIYFPRAERYGLYWHPFRAWRDVVRIGATDDTRFGRCMRKIAIWPILWIANIVAILAAFLAAAGLGLVG